MKNSRNRGFTLIEGVLILAVIGLITFACWYAYRQHYKNAITATSGFKVVGNKIIAPSGKQFVPYGIVIECTGKKMASISDVCTGKDPSQNTGSAIVNAAAKGWNANIVRFQVAQESLYSGTKGSINQDYVNLLDSLINQANSLGMVATITLQTEDQNGYAYPTSSSVTFWQYIANHYRDHPNVFFDLFNEPRLPIDAFGATGKEDDLWRVWQNGGTALAAGGTGSKLESGQVNYVGMQTLVDTVRSEGANNIIIAESPGGDKDLSELTTHYLSGTNIAYGVEPNLIYPNKTTDTTQSEQYTHFGQYTKVVPIMPEAFLDNYGFQNCDPNSPKDLPVLLSYLKSINMGLIFWTLNPGVGIIGNNLNNPTYYPNGATSIASPYCPNKGSSQSNASNTIGDGALLQTYFKANSVQLSH